MSLLGLDVGTTGCKAYAFNLAGQVIASASRDYPRLYPKPGWVEIDPDLFLRVVDEVVTECADQTRADPIRAIGLSTLGAVLAAIDRDARPIVNPIGSTDNRAGQEIAWWRAQIPLEELYAITGTPILPNTALYRILWLQRHKPDVYERAWKFVTAIELVAAHLGAEVVVDRATASTMNMYDLKADAWSDVILAKAGIERDKLPPIVPAGAAIGQVRADLAALPGIAPNACIVSGGMDQQVAAFGAGLLHPGIATDSLGTVECITTAFEQPRFAPGLLRNHYSNILHVYGGLTTCMAYNFTSGDMVRWYLRTFDDQGEPPSPESFARAWATMPEAPSDVLVLPHLPGSGTPWLDQASRGAIAGLRLDTTRRDIFKGLMDCQNYEMRLNLEIWREHGMRVERLRSYGGGARDDKALQLKADILEMEVARLALGEAGCVGAAALAGLGAGLFAEPTGWLNLTVKEETVFTPNPRWAETYREKFALYRDLYPALRPIHHRCP